MEKDKSANKREKGAVGEKQAVQFLLKNNYNILKTNFRVGRIGEIDIIAEDAEYICFIEVKSRSTNRFGNPAEAVNLPKQKKIKLLAEIYLSNTGNSEKCVRFDVVEIIMKKGNACNEIIDINLIKNAF